MAKPIELGLVLEGDDAKVFFRNERNPASKEKKIMFSQAREIYNKNRF